MSCMVGGYNFRPSILRHLNCCRLEKNRIHHEISEVTQARPCAGYLGMRLFSEQLQPK
jgi:hypothetical protein